MLARFKTTECGYGEAQKPIGEIEVWDGDAMEWRPATPDELLPALIELVSELYAWKQRVIR